jgi:DNA-binding transcriptional MerR regulator
LTLLYITVIIASMSGRPVTRWTLDQLAERVGAALSVDYEGQASGRVREVPDQRAIRYYTTIGLVDRPAAMRGRTALYVRRHLLQLVAIKRLQAYGLSLARIQRELAGATDAQLERLARVPPLEEPAAAAQETGEPAAATREVGHMRVAAQEVERMPAAAPPTAAPAARHAFWKRAAQPLAAPPPGSQPPPPEAPAPAEAPAAGAGASAPAEAPAAGAAGVVALQGLRLGEGVTLLVEGARPLGADELAAIRAAAAPLLDVVRRGRERS